ncbi:MAG: methyltransferase [Armatimonadetes bacterium]|nr:methyltransferase [Armatimonadota bacterium]
MDPRARLQAALEHRLPDRLPVDFGSTAVTGMHVSAVTRLRRALFGDVHWRVKVIEPYQMLGEIDFELRRALGIDVVGVFPRGNLFGFENRDWKGFRLFDGIEVLVPGDFVTTKAANGDLLIYPGGDTSVPPSGRMPVASHFFDTIVRQDPVAEDHLDPADNCEEFQPFGDADLAYYRAQRDELDKHPDLGVNLTMPGTGFGDIALVPAPFLKRPKGIRDVEEWYVSTAIRRDYVREVFERQCEVGLANLATLIDLFGERVQAVFLTGTDFGSQRAPFISPAAYRELFQPFHKRVNKLVHERSGWKSFIHSCGCVFPLLPDFISAGFDILNPVQTSAAEMDARRLKEQFGDRLTFWGGGVDTQQTLAFGTPHEVYRHVLERIDVLGAGGGFVFNAIHNVQADTALDNMLSMFRAIRDSAEVGSRL